MNTQFADKLNTWYQADHRDLPFRRFKDPYAIWVSEVMAQQTRIESMLPYYEAWMQKWPTVYDLAQAPLDEVLHLWQGLGYYNRARKLHQGAQIIVNQYHGQVPDQKEELLKIPGIGAYTAGAILSICFDQKEAAVDGNVLRVISRYDGIDEDVMKAKVRQLIEQRVLHLMHNPSVFTQALMELGARVCTFKNPSCTLCPLQDSCKAYSLQIQHLLPVKTPKKKPVEINLNTYVVIKDQNILLSQDDSDGLMKGLIRLPQSEKQLVQDAELIGETKHVFSHRVWKMKLYQVHDSVELKDCFWWPIAQLNELSICTAHRKILKNLFRLT